MEVDVDAKNEHSWEAGHTEGSIRLAAEVMKNPESAAVWWEFLLHEERLWSGIDKKKFINAAMVAGRDGIVTLSDLYVWATRVVPRQPNYKTLPFVNIWLGHAAQQWHRNPDDARDTFKALKSQHIGENYAPLYAEWAGLEAKYGNVRKASSVVSKGLREGAEPSRMLEALEQSLNDGKYDYIPFWKLIQEYTCNESERSQRDKIPNHEGRECAVQRTLPVARSLPEQGIKLSSSSTPSNRKIEDSLVTPSVIESTERYQRPSYNMEPSQNFDRIGKLPMVTPGSRSSKSMCDAWRTENKIVTNKSSFYPSENISKIHQNSRHSDVSILSSESSHQAQSSSTMHSTSITGYNSSSDGSTAHLRARTPAIRSNALLTGNISIKSNSFCSSGGEEATVHLNHDQKHASMNQAIVNCAAEENLPKNSTSRALSSCMHTSIATGSSSFSGKAMRIATPGNRAQQQDPGRDDEDNFAVRKGQPEGIVAGSLVLETTQHAASDSEEKYPSGSNANDMKVSDQNCKLTTGCRNLALNENSVCHGDKTFSQATEDQMQNKYQGSSGSINVTTMSNSGRKQIILDDAHTERVSGSRVNSATYKSTDNYMEREEETVPIPNQTKGHHSMKSSNEPRGDMSFQGTVAVRNMGLDGRYSAVSTPRPVKNIESQRALVNNLQTRGLQMKNKVDSIPGTSLSISSNQPKIGMTPNPVPRRCMADPLPSTATNSRATAVSDTEPVPNDCQAQQNIHVNRNHREKTAAEKEKLPIPELVRRVIEDENVAVVRGITYTKLECVGRGGSSKVYKVMAPNRKIFAMKRIRLNGRDSEAAAGFLDEITLLKKLQGRSNIIQLIDSEVHSKEGLIYMVLEFGDIDLAKLLQRHEQTRRERLQELQKGNDRACKSSQSNCQQYQIDENFIRLYWEQMLGAVDTIHRVRIVHSDLKPANFLVVEGQLKLIDFGIAKAIQNDTTSIARESQVGTLNYMSPEAILGGNTAPKGDKVVKVGRASDIWSLGCILYQMVYGRTPFAHLQFIQKMHAIIDENHQIQFPPIRNSYLLDVMKRCLDRNPKTRITMAELLEHPFLHPEEISLSSSNCLNDATGVSDSIELSHEQLRKLLIKISKAGVSDADVGTLSEKLFEQLSHGQLSPDVVEKKTAYQNEKYLNNNEVKNKENDRSWRIQENVSNRQASSHMEPHLGRGTHNCSEDQRLPFAPLRLKEEIGDMKDTDPMNKSNLGLDSNDNKIPLRNSVFR